MEVRLAQPLGYSELGSRSNNEDSLYPDPRYASTGQKWFIVCDGVGGLERGEVASSLAVTSLDAFLRQRPVVVVTDDFVQQGVAYIETQFNRYLGDHEEAVGMATTLTLVYFHEAGATVAHIGDSRVYHIRNGRVIWRTDDHSYVNELLKAGVVSLSEARRHPQRNVITRALQGATKPTEASVQIINDLRPGDYFFLCTDGVLERISDELLESTLYPPNQSNEQKLETLRRYSLGNTRDNFTAYLIQIEQVIGTVDSAYRVVPPTYERRYDETDADESITLINAPIPDVVRSHSPSSNNGWVEDSEIAFSDQTQISKSTSQVDTTNFALTQPQGATTSRSPSSGGNSNTKETFHTGNAPDKPTQNRTQSRSSRSRLIPTLVLTVALVGLGVFITWHYYDNGLSNSNKPTKEVTQSMPAPRPKPHKVFQATSDPDNNEPESLTGSATSPIGVSDVAGLAKKTEPQETTPTISTNQGQGERSVQVVKKIDNKLSVVRNPRTGLMGLQNASGKSIGQLVYSSIGDFKNGIATANLQGRDGYLNRDGRWFDEVTDAHNGKVAVRKGDRWGYLNMEGRVSIDLKYDQAKPFQADGTAEVVLKGKTMRIDKQGKDVSNLAQVK